MKRLSLKIKLTVLYTFFMVLVTCAALAILFFSEQPGSAVLYTVQTGKKGQESTDDILLRNGELKLETDFYSVTQDVYLSLYDDSICIFSMERFLMALTPSPSSRTVRQEVLQREIQNGMFRHVLPSGGELYSIYPGSHVCYGRRGKFYGYSPVRAHSAAGACYCDGVYRIPQ